MGGPALDRRGPLNSPRTAGGDVLIVPGHALILLIGPPGSGKSTFAARHFGPTEILSSDAFRAMVADDEDDQRATPAAFDLLHRAAGHRLTRARLTVIDATNLRPADRRALLGLARAWNRPAVALVFAVPEAVAQERNRGRPERMVDAAVVARGASLARAIGDRPAPLLDEGFAAVHVLRDPVAIDRLRIARVGRATRAIRSPSRATRTAGSPARTS